VGKAATFLLAGLVCATVCFVPAGSAAKKRQTAQPPQPNIVLIMDDDQSVVMQRFLAKTNALIGGQGVTFDNSFVNDPLCCPSRSTMLTGQYTHNHGVRGNSPPSGGYAKLAPTLGNSLPVWLQRSGYYTAHVGKFLNGYGTDSPDTEVPPGWNEWYGSLDDPDGFTGGSYTAYGYALNQNGTVVHYGSTPNVVTPGTWQTDVYSQQAADLIRRHAPSSQPFFLSVAPRDPHLEFGGYGGSTNNPRAAPRYDGKLAGLTAPRDPSFNEANVSDKPSNIRDISLLTPTQIAEIDARYRDQAEALLGVDDLVENVVNTLQAQGELDNTVLIFTSDNGFFYGEHRVESDKVRIYEPSIRVPLLIRGPGVPRAVHRAQPVYNVDLAPTILDYANAAPGRTQDGVSLLRVLDGKRNWLGRALDLETYHYAASPEDPESPPLFYRGVRTDRYLYAEYGTGERELYDLRKDPFELENAVRKRPYVDAQRALRRLLARLAGCAGAGCEQPPALKLRVQGCTAVVAGKGKAQDATFYVRDKKVGADSKAPIRKLLPHAASGATVEAIATSLDGRRVTLTKRLRGC
jgi:N-acetylglucosamine-6-sulfatase